MPFIKFFRCNVRHAVALVIYFSFYLLISLHFSFHLSTFREYSKIGKGLLPSLNLNFILSDQCKQFFLKLLKSCIDISS